MHSHNPTPAPDSTPIHEVRGACNLCEAICGLTFQVQGQRIVSIKGDEQDPLSRGHICPKAVALKDLHEDPDRLRQPVKRVTLANGQTHWQPISWDEAFDLTVQGLVRMREQHGSQAVAVYQGNPNVHNWGNITHGHLLFAQLKTRHRYSATSVDQLPHHLVSLWLYGHQFRLPIPDIDRTQFMLILGGNPLASNGSLMTVPDVRKRFKALQQRGGKLVVIDPRRSETAEVADEHHFIDPGTDAFWLLSIIHTLLSEGLCKAGVWQPLLDGMEALTQAVTAFTPEATETLTGISASNTRRLAREMASASSAVCYGRMGVSTQAHGVVCQWAIQVINLLTGNVDREGGALLTHPAVDLIKLGLAGKGHHALWRSRVRGAPEFSGELPVSVMAEEMLTPGQGQVKALVTACGNPVLSTPNGRQLDKALAGLDFMVSVDFYVNETTRHAHVILPPTCFVEHDHYDLIFQAFAVRNVAKYVAPVVPPAPGAMHDWQIYAELARRYAQRVWPLQRASMGERIKGMLTRGVLGQTSPRRLLQMALWRGPSGVRLKNLLQHPQGIDLGPLRPGLRETLHRLQRQVPLLPSAMAQALPDLQALLLGATPLVSAQGTALKLIGRRDVRSNNSWMHNSERLVSGKTRCVLWMHPQDAQLRGLSMHQAVAVQSRVGSITVPLHITPDIRPGVVSLPHGWGHDRAGIQLRVAQAHAGASINDLTDDRLIDTISGNAAFSAVPVEVRAA
jgi:anaerobic selenocysteine-containing dehydrogenase